MVTELRLRWQRALQHWETKMMILSSFARDFKIHQHCSSTCWKTVALNKCFALSIFYNSSHAHAFNIPTSQREWEREGSGSCSCPITNSGHWETTLQLLSSPTAPTAPQRCSTTNSNPCAGAQPPLLGPRSHQHWAGEISDKNWGPLGPAPAPEGPPRASAQLQRPLGPLELSTEGEACRPQVTGLPFELCSGKRRLNRVAFLALHDRRLSHFSIFLHGIYRSEAV